ncbi:uncharacterized protein LOC122502656 isoform X2 [Leptopilina heterotoma]|uniref:uncharacterized protein LOC122502656 isoform X2 n=1 Tax=Leptopilina heterotoma TaxID=63436 RepID=UPI001CA8D5B6|nr:uncharacterized protein LOC122502656 isoform X2 [Leptopilina heterotoma]
MSNEQENTNSITSIEKNNTETSLDIRSNVRPAKEIAENSGNESTKICQQMTQFCAIQFADSLIPTFDGTSSVFCFIDDINTVTESIKSFCDERLIIAIIIKKLSDELKEFAYRKQFKSINDLTDYLKHRCAPKKSVNYYIDEIYNLRINSNETLNEFHDRLEIFISKTRAAWKYQNNSDIEKGLMSYVQHVAIKSFIRALPYNWGELVFAKKPKDLLDAFSYFCWIEIVS